MADYFCDFCGAHAEVDDECLHLDASRPDAYRQVVEMQPYTAACGRCGAPVVVPRPTLYTDRERGFAVRMRPSGFRSPLYTGPLDYTLRETPFLLEFREKVMLLSNGFDDVTVELLKRKTVEANPKEDFVDIVCMGVQKDHLQMRGIRTDRNSIPFNTPLELYESVLAAKPEGLDPEGFAQVDQDWLLDRLENLQEK